MNGDVSHEYQGGNGTVIRGDDWQFAEDFVAVVGTDDRPNDQPCLIW